MKKREKDRGEQAVLGMITKLSTSNRYIIYILAIRPVVTWLRWCARSLHCKDMILPFVTNKEVVGRSFETKYPVLKLSPTSLSIHWWLLTELVIMVVAMWWFFKSHFCFHIYWLAFSYKEGLPFTLLYLNQCGHEHLLI